MLIDEAFENFAAENEERCRKDFQHDCLFHNTPIIQQHLAWRYYSSGWMHAAFASELHLLEIVKIIGASDGDATDMSNKLVALRRLIADHLP